MAFHVQHENIARLENFKKLNNEISDRKCNLNETSIHFVLNNQVMYIFTINMFLESKAIRYVIQSSIVKTQSLY